MTLDSTSTHEHKFVCFHLSQFSQTEQRYCIGYTSCTHINASITKTRTDDSITCITSSDFRKLTNFLVSLVDEILCTFVRISQRLNTSVHSRFTFNTTVSTKRKFTSHRTGLRSTSYTRELSRELTKNVCYLPVFNTGTKHVFREVFSTRTTPQLTPVSPVFTFLFRRTLCRDKSLATVNHIVSNNISLFKLCIQHNFEEAFINTGFCIFQRRVFYCNHLIRF